MNNLKRTLSLALAGVMTLGVMTVSASAAEFTDADSIKNTTAVETMTAIKVINGRGDGTFDPTATVNRAEMATMIAKALNGGEVPNLGLAGQNYFSDVKADQWFAEAVNYCYSLGIIAGRGDGTFDPAGSVTGWEAAKMMLVAMGYDSDIFGFTGSTWNTNVDYYASNLTVGEKPATGKKATYVSMYDNVAGQRALPLTRQDAAQLIYNGMNANTITKTVSGIQNGAPVYSYDMYSGTLLENKFGAETITGLLTNSSYDADNKVWTYTFEDGTDVISANDYSGLFMRNVIAIYLENDGVNEAKGISALNSTLITKGKDIGLVNVDLNNAKLDGHKYSDKLTAYHINDDSTVITIKYSSKSDFRASLGNKWDKYDAIDNDGDGTIDVIVTYPTKVEKITAQDKAKTYVTTKSGTYKYNATKGNNATTEDSLAKGDWIQIYEVPGTSTYTLTKVELTEEAHQVTGTNVGSTAYYFSGMSSSWSINNGQSVKVGNSYKLGIINGEWIVAVEEVDDKVTITENNVVCVVKVATEVDTITGGKYEDSKYTHTVQAYFSDGTVQDIVVENVDGKDINKDTYKVSSDVKLYSYTVKDGKYTLTALDSSETLGYQQVYTTTITEMTEGGKINNGRITFANDGIFFVTYMKDGKTVTEVFSGKQINSWGFDGKQKMDKVALYGDFDSNNIMELSYGTFALVDSKSTVTTLPDASGVTGLYAVAMTGMQVVWDAEYDNGKGRQIAKFDAWDGTETKTFYTTTLYDGSLDTPAVGCVFTYTTDANGVIIDYTRLNTKTDVVENAFYVSAIAGDNIWLNKGGEDIAYKLTDDTKVIFVENTVYQGDKFTSGNNTISGVAEGSIELGKLVNLDNEDEGYYANVVAHDANGDGKLELLVVDLNGFMRYSLKTVPYIFGAK